MGKSLALILFLVMVVSSLSLLMVKPANAQTIAKPSLPEFTVQVVEYGYQMNILTNQIFLMDIILQVSFTT